MTAEDRETIRAIAREIRCNERTVRRWWLGLAVSPVVQYAITAAVWNLELRRRRQAVAWWKRFGFEPVSVLAANEDKRI